MPFTQSSSLTIYLTVMQQSHFGRQQVFLAAARSSGRLVVQARDSGSAIGLSALSAAHFHELRTGVSQEVTVDARHAVLEFKSEAYYTINHRVPEGGLFDPLAGTYKTKDGNWVRIHTNFSHHRDGILSILGCAASKQAIASALSKWNSFEFEDEAAKRGMVATAFRSFDQWDASPQGRALQNIPPVEIRKIADAPKREVTGGSLRRPLQGIRVLDLTRVLAGPVCGRTLADTETSRGKRTTQLDLSTPINCETMASLAENADVFLQAYRPDGLADKGFAVDDVVRMRKGKSVVYASLRAYGWDGPWQNRRGFDSLVQTAMGFNHAEAEAYASYKHEESEQLVPKPLPMQALDHAAGYFLAFGINTALCRTLTEGGSWEVRVSLAAVGNWIRSPERLEPGVAFGEGRPLPPAGSLQDAEIVSASRSLMQSLGDHPLLSERKGMTALRHAAMPSATPVEEGEAPMRLNAHEPQWRADV